MKKHLQILNRELKARIQKNTRYSLRAYAKFLGLHSSALSRVMTGKLELTSENGVKIAKRLKLSHDESRLFLRSILEAREGREIEKICRLMDMPSFRPPVLPLADETYSRIARLEVLAFLQLTHLSDFSDDSSWIANALGLTRERVEDLTSMLLEAGVLQRSPEGKLTNAHLHLTAVETEKTNETRKHLQLEIAQAAVASLERDPFEERAHYGMTMAIDPAKLPRARERILTFLEELADELECGERSRVYQLAISLFPLSRKMH